MFPALVSLHPHKTWVKNRNQVQKCFLKCQELICAHSASHKRACLWSPLCHLAAAVANTWATAEHTKGMQDPTLPRCHNNKNAVHKHLRFCVKFLINMDTQKYSVEATLSPGKDCREQVPKAEHQGNDNQVLLQILLWLYEFLLAVTSPLGEVLMQHLSY